MTITFPGSASSQILSNSSGVPTTRLFSINCWMKFTSASISYLVTLDSATSGQYALLGKVLGAVYFDWAGTGTSQSGGHTVSNGVWYRVAVSVNGNNATLYVATATGSWSTYTQGVNFTLPTGTLSWKLGGSTANSNNAAGDLANVKIWDDELTLAEHDAESTRYLPRRLTNLSRWYPLVINSTTDYGPNGRTLSGGTGVTTSTDSGPPINWGGFTPQTFIPWDPTSTVYYAVYTVADGELYSIGATLASPLDASYAYKEYIGTQPDRTIYEWTPTGLDFLYRPSVQVIDRVYDDLTNDATLSAVWADLTAGNQTTLKTRLATLLGPYRYRSAGDPVDL